MSSAVTSHSSHQLLGDPHWKNRNSTTTHNPTLYNSNNNDSSSNDNGSSPPLDAGMYNIDRVKD